MINITTQNRTKNKKNLNFQQPIQLNQKKLESELNLCETEFNGKDVFLYNAVDKIVPIFSKSVNNFNNFNEYDKKEFVNTLLGEAQKKQHEISIINKLKQLTTSSNNNIKNIENSDSDNLFILTYFSKLPKNNTNYNLNQKKINLVFSIDQFLFEISKKQPQRRKYSEYHKQLKEKKKLSIFYGYLSKKQLKNLLSECQSYQSHFCENLFSLLERRLDIFLYRSGLAKNIITARQLIAHKKIMVNKNIVNIASYQIKPGDIISMSLSLSKKTQLMKVDGVSTLSIDNNKREPEQYIVKPSSHVSGGLRRNVNEKKNTFKYKEKNISRLKPLFLMLTNFNLFQLNEKTLKNSKKKTTLKNLVGFLLKKIDKYNNNNKQQKKKYYTTSRFSPKTLSLYRNVVYKVLLDMNSYFFYSNCFNSNYESTKKKNRTNNLLILKLRKHTNAINRSNNIIHSIERSKFYGNYGNRENSRINTISSTYNNVLKPLGYSFVVPLHIEISYSIKTAIFLYSPQRLNFPFYIDVDLILRSLN